MSKKNGKKQENGAGKGSEVNPDSQKWRGEDARKNDEAYTMVQRAMFSSQVYHDIPVILENADTVVVVTAVRCVQRLLWCFWGPC